MPNISSSQHHLDLARHLSTSVAVGKDSVPIVVYRGEHGESTDVIHSRTRAISFSNAQAASTYATQPNNPDDKPVAPRVMAAYLSITNPVVADRDDPFIDMSTIAAKLGVTKTTTIALRLADHIEHTCNWVDRFEPMFESVADLLDRNPELLSELYLDAYPVFDDDEIVGWFAEAGYDGAVHAGAGETAAEIEYKVFYRSQIHFAIGVDHEALVRALAQLRTEERVLQVAGAGAEDPRGAESSLLKFQSNYRGQTAYQVLAGPLAGKRVTYRYMKREFYEQDYADYGGQVWRGDPGSYRREVLSSVGLVCCSDGRVPQDIVDEVNRLAGAWREHDSMIARKPARAGVYVGRHGWTEAADVVFRYGAVLERFNSLAEAERWLSQPSRARPDQAWEEGAGGDVLRELSPAPARDGIALIEVEALDEDTDDAPVMAHSG
ncbi:hypothetical protein [Massilia varians]|uniref:hypothetical protein n=1 Tax=Massilia varians TaxID=457921 RepID=UPI002555B526|nr:hypothetical protein [Massilia varians]MDK6076208.1 hypothetical protein [Massilia varians]